MRNSELVWEALEGYHFMPMFQAKVPYYLGTYFSEEELSPVARSASACR